MKKAYIKIIGISLLLCLFINNNLMAQVGIGTISPDASSILDIQSTSKGMLIPRMETSDRTSISSPANGLLVFDTNTQSFWFYNFNVWKELSDSAIGDDDDDTKIEVEKTTDSDEINFTTDGTEYMKINSSGDILLGNRASSTIPDSDTTSEQNYTKITADGSLSYVGNATRWDDLKVNVQRLTAKGVSRPTMDDVLDAGAGPGLYTYWFNKNSEQELFFTVQMPHGWKEGSDIKPHVHWIGNAGSGNVEWGLEYTWANVNDMFSGATTTLTGYTAISGYVNYKHMLTPLGNMDATGKTLSSIILCRVFRYASSSNDTFSANAGLLQIDFHYQIDSDGSNDELSKF